MKYLYILALVAFALVGGSKAYAADAIYTGIFSNKAVSGYDTVAYFTEEDSVKGSSDFMTEYRGVKWYFSSNKNLELFKKNPTRYAPQYGGHCSYTVAQGALAKGDPEVWNIVNGKLYLNYDKSIEAKWLPNKEEFIMIADEKYPELIK